MSQTTTPSGADVLKLLALVNAASPGPWETDVIKCDGEYGDGGPNGRSGYMAEQMHDANGVAIFDSLNSEGTMVDEDIGEESVYAWDVVANRNFEAVAAAMNFIREHGPAVAALIARNAELEAAHKAQMSADDVLSAIEDSAICLENWGELHEARDLRRAAYTLIADRDALAAENKALREAAINLVIDPEDPNIGWRGRASTDGVFACEHCKSEHWDCIALVHDDSCPVPAMIEAARIALARKPAKGNDDG